MKTKKKLCSYFSYCESSNNCTTFCKLQQCRSTRKKISGNYNYQNPNAYQNPVVNTIQTSYSNDQEMVISIKGIYNEKQQVNVRFLASCKLAKQPKKLQH